MKTVKPITCKVCKAAFTPFRSFQNWCSPDCGAVLANEKLEKKAKKAASDERKVTREKLDALRKQPELKALAQRAFNKFIRARDAGKPCISCGKPDTGEANSTDCGHFRSVGSAPHLRFTEHNAAGQCKKCNLFLSGNAVEYRKGLIERIGIRYVEILEADYALRKYTKEGLVEIAKHYNAETKKLKAACNP